MSYAILVSERLLDDLADHAQLGRGHASRASISAVLDRAILRMLDALEGSPAPLCPACAQPIEHCDYGPACRAAAQRAAVERAGARLAA